MNQFVFDPAVPCTIWKFELHRPSVHEHRTDGTVITHLRPSGGKSALMNILIEQFRGRENASNSTGWKPVAMSRMPPQEIPTARLVEDLK